MDVISRSSGTEIVTAAIVEWLWRKKFRAIVREAGIGVGGKPTRPLSGRWRSDVLAAMTGNLCLVEVKGSKADSARELYDRGKWVIDYQAVGVTPVFACLKTVDYSDVPDSWGVLTVDATTLATKIMRRPVWAEAGEDQVAAAMTVIAEVSTGAGLPTMLGSQGRKRALSLLGNIYPWRAWEGE